MYKTRMDIVALVPTLLLFALAVGMIMPVKGTFNSVTVVSYNELTKTQNGEVLCALDTANETTTSSSSLEDCSLRCANDATCSGFNIKNELTCDVYNYRPKITALVSACMFYQVHTISNLLSFHIGAYNSLHIHVIARNSISANRII